jgi:hypothetical protein
MLLMQRPEFSFRKPLLAAARRNHSRSASFPEAVIACMVDSRRPSQREIATIAARIWKDCRRSDEPPWQDVAPESRLYKSMIAAARAALGDMPSARPLRRS